MSLFDAIKNNDNDLFQKILPNCGVNQRDCLGDTPLHIAAAYNQVVMVERLLEYGADVNARGCAGASPLMCACQNSIISTRLLETGANINFTNDHGCSVLHFAICQSNQNVNKEIIKLLLNWNINVSLTSRCGETAEDMGKRFRKYNLVQFMESYINFINKTKKIWNLWELE